MTNFVFCLPYLYQSLIVFINKHGQELITVTRRGYLTDTALRHPLWVVFVLRGDCENDGILKTDLYAATRSNVCFPITEKYWCTIICNGVADRQCDCKWLRFFWVCKYTLEIRQFIDR